MDLTKVQSFVIINSSNGESKDILPFLLSISAGREEVETYISDDLYVSQTSPILVPKWR